MGDIAEPKTASTVVRVNGQWLVRDGDSFWMNRRNTGGELIYKKDRGKRWPPEDRPAIDDSEAEALLAKAQADGAEIAYYGSDDEKTGKAKIASAANLSGYSSLLRACAGRAAGAAGLPRHRQDADRHRHAQVAPAGDHAAPPAAQAHGRRQGQPDRGHRAGGDADRRPLRGHLRGEEGADRHHAADPARTVALRPGGGAARRLQAGLRQQQLSPSRCCPRIEGFHAYDAKVRDSLAQQIAEERARAKETTTAPAPATDTSGGGGGKDGTRITGDKDDCEPEPYDENKCGEGEARTTSCPTSSWRVGTRLDPGVRMPGAPSLDKGPSICLNKDDHAEVHRKISEGMRAKIGSNGTVTLKDVLDISIDALDEVKPDCKRQFEQPIRDAFEDHPRRNARTGPDEDLRRTARTAAERVAHGMTTRKAPSPTMTPLTQPDRIRLQIEAAAPRGRDDLFLACSNADARFEGFARLCQYRAGQRSALALHRPAGHGRRRPLLLAPARRPRRGLRLPHRGRRRDASCRPAARAMTERIEGAGLWRRRPRRRARMIKLAQIGGRLHACGGGGQIYRRTKPGAWEHMDTGLLREKGEKKSISFRRSPARTNGRSTRAAGSRT